MVADVALLALVVHGQQVHGFADYLHVGDDAGAAAFAAALAGNGEADFAAAVADAPAEVGVVAKSSSRVAYSPRNEAELLAGAGEDHVGLAVDGTGFVGRHEQVDLVLVVANTNPIPLRQYQRVLYTLTNTNSKQGKN